VWSGNGSTNKGVMIARPARGDLDTNGYKVITYKGGPARRTCVYSCMRDEREGV
jgi:hypothetical protein